MNQKQFTDLFISAYQTLADDCTEEKLDKIKTIGASAHDMLHKQWMANLDLVPEIQEIIKTKDIVAFKELLKNDSKTTGYVIGGDVLNPQVSEANLHVQMLKNTVEVMEGESDINLEFFVSLAGYYTSKVRLGREVLHTLNKYFEDHFDISAILMEVAAERLQNDPMDTLKQIMGLLDQED
jgi:hypothetical protein